MSQAQTDMKVREAGAAFLDHLTKMYASKRLSAIDFSIACHWCQEAHVRGADFTQFAVPPGQSSRNYQQKVDRALPPFQPLCRLPTPTMQKTGAGGRFATCQ